MQNGCSILIHSSLDEIRGNILHGWILSASQDARPLILVNGRPAILLDSSIPRPDVLTHYNLKKPLCTGFACLLPAAARGALIELFAITTGGVHLLARKILNRDLPEDNPIIQISRAAKIAKQSGSVGIVCWDGSHNSIGRAKTLYDIVSQKRPAVLISYTHEEFGGKLWGPLEQWTGNLITIPWQKRRVLYSLLKFYGVEFDTLWICKPRLPSFRLASIVSKEHSKYILDIDDNESAMMADPNMPEREYYAQGLGISNFLRDMIHSRTVSGSAIQDVFGGHIVRHARQHLQVASCDNEKKRIGFIGTVRPHKNVDVLARAIRMVSISGNMPMEFHVFGDVIPAEYRQELENAGANIHSGPAMTELPNVISKLDVLTCGYGVTNDNPGKPIAEMQTPAKISDALASGKPVLVPDWPGLEELKEITGVYFFNEENFQRQLTRALNHEGSITLPNDFTLDGAYLSFIKAEKEAKTCEFIRRLEVIPPQNHLGKNIVLLWKQHDAGLYGRRVDQIARCCKRKNPECNIYVLEFMEDMPKEEDLENFSGEADLKLNFFTHKQNGMENDGIFYKLITGNPTNSILEFFSEMAILPENSLLIIFPLIDVWKKIAFLLSPYKYLLDIVDNQLGWANNAEENLEQLEQYYSLMINAGIVIFNCPQNRNFFLERECTVPEKTVVIPNWYELPSNFVPIKRKFDDNKLHLFYSGNMNDRVDWGLLGHITNMPNVALHIVGTACRESDRLKELIVKGAIYHGVLQEKETLNLLEFMDAAIVPHVQDRISTYMHPIKIHMYAKLKLPVIAPVFLKWAGTGLIIYENEKNCLEKIVELPTYDLNYDDSLSNDWENQYNKIIQYFLQNMKKFDN